MRRQRNRKIGVHKKRSTRPRNQKQSLGEREHVLDSYEVREWFAADPAACVSDVSAQKILREYEHPSRWWITSPVHNAEDRVRFRSEKSTRSTVGRRSARESRGMGIPKEMVGLVHRTSEALVADQFTPWRQSLQSHLRVILPDEVIDRFSDYLSGYLLVMENETPRRSAPWENRKKKISSGRQPKKKMMMINNGRQLKKLLRKLNERPGDLDSMLPASATPPHQEALKTKLIRVMSEELVALGYSRDVIAYRFLPFVWNAVGDKILDRSFLRAERRSRQRTGRRQ